MSCNWYLSCKETKTRICIGQGYGEMKGFYYGMPEVMQNLKSYFNYNEGKSIKFSSEHDEEIWEYTEDWSRMKKPSV